MITDWKKGNGIDKGNPKFKTVLQRIPRVIVKTFKEKYMVGNESFGSSLYRVLKRKGLI